MLPILGYKLYADHGFDDNFWLIYDGTNMPQNTNYIYSSSSLNPLLTYRFYVTAINFNGEGSPSPIAGLQPCTTPSGMNAPSIADVT